MNLVNVAEKVPSRENSWKDEDNAACVPDNKHLATEIETNLKN